MTNKCRPLLSLVSTSTAVVKFEPWMALVSCVFTIFTFSFTIHNYNSRYGWSIIKRTSYCNFYNHLPLKLNDYIFCTDLSIDLFKTVVTIVSTESLPYLPTNDDSKFSICKVLCSTNASPKVNFEWDYKYLS